MCVFIGNQTIYNVYTVNNNLQSSRTQQSVKLLGVTICGLRITNIHPCSLVISIYIDCCLTVLLSAGPGPGGWFKCLPLKKRSGILVM